MEPRRWRLSCMTAAPATNAHNYFLQTLAEQGVVGLMALLAILAPRHSFRRFAELLDVTY